MNKFFKEALEAGYIEPVMKDDEHFQMDGVLYYQPTESGSKMSISRFHSALDIIRMHEEMKLSYEQNKAAWDRVAALTSLILSSQDSIAIQGHCLDIMDIQRQIQSRMDFGRDIEQVYQITAIYFVTENENPSEINTKTINDKIRSFKSDPELYSFFLAQPLSRLLGSSTVSDVATMSYLKELQLQEILNLRYFLMKLQRDGRELDTINSITSRIETLEESLNLVGSLLSNTTTASQES